MNKKKIIFTIISVLILSSFYISIRKHGPSPTTKNRKKSTVIQNNEKKIISTFQVSGNIQKGDISNNKVSKDIKELRFKIIKKILSNVYSDIQFEILDKCPNEHNILSSEQADFDISCAKEATSSESIFQYGKIQNYMNGSLVSYYEMAESYEPIFIKFSGGDQIDRITLYIAGLDIVTISFNRNLVQNYKLNLEAQKESHLNLKYTYDYYVKNDHDDTYAKKKIAMRLAKLQMAKAKLLKVLSHLCDVSKHKKTCDAYKELFEFPYPGVEINQIIKHNERGSE
jgi:hypothetical protein